MKEWRKYFGLTAKLCLAILRMRPEDSISLLEIEFSKFKSTLPSDIRLVEIQRGTSNIRQPACLNLTSSLLKSKKGLRNRKENGECTNALNGTSRVGLSNSFYKYETYWHSTNVKEHI